MISTIDGIRYHRNGVGGAGFHAVQFTIPAAGDGQPIHLLGIVHDAEAQSRVGAVLVSVIEPTNPESKWRGDVFEPELREAILRWEAMG